MRTLACLAVLLTSLRGATSATLPPPPTRAAAVQMFQAWKAPVPPRHLAGNIYYVGAIGVSSFLITTPEGHILIDTGFEETVPLIQRSIEQLGFKPGDIKFILSSHAHVDHTGGHAAMKRLTGATIVASAADAELLASGGANDFSPFPKDLLRYAPVRAERIVHDGDVLSLGGTQLIAHLTPGHTRGATSWTMKASDAGIERNVVFFSSVSIVESTSLLDHPAYPGIADDYRATFAKLKSLPCDIWFAPHGGQFAMAEKFARLEDGAATNPFVDPEGWTRLLASAEKSFLRQLELETASDTANRSR